jgi:hypothetical protein
MIVNATNDVYTVSLMLYSTFWVEEGMEEINQMGLQVSTGIPRPNVINLFSSIN